MHFNWLMGYKLVVVCIMQLIPIHPKKGFVDKHWFHLGFIFLYYLFLVSQLLFLTDLHINNGSPKLFRSRLPFVSLTF
ncbi:hypothetical protein EDC94DRAFT_616450 [Helicostylum pulchrum]|nr:hypothetical protein EDC94DRAFT_616450 [Helicostylum pulchrum]